MFMTRTVERQAESGIPTNPNHPATGPFRSERDDGRYDQRLYRTLLSTFEHQFHYARTLAARCGHNADERDE